MRSLLAVLRHGRDLRHLPVALRPEDRSAVVAIAERDDGSSGRVEHVPVALHPLTIAIRPDAVPSGDAVRLIMRHVPGEADASGGHGDPAARQHESDAATRRHDVRSARIELGPARQLEIGGLRLSLHEPVRGTNQFQPQPRRSWTYLLAWRKATSTRGNPGGLGMTARELRALDCYYVWPRPVYLVGVRHGDRSNLFPMDLVGPLGSQRFTLALRTRSPSVETMKESRRVVLSVAPASWKEIVYQLGAHHRRASIETSALPFPLRSSRNFDLPVPAGAPGYFEVEIQDCRAIGSHTFFAGTVVHTEDADTGRVPQLAHVSALYAGWRVREDRPLTEA